MRGGGIHLAMSMGDRKVGLVPLNVHLTLRRRGGGSRELPMNVKGKRSKTKYFIQQNPSPRGWRPANFMIVRYTRFFLIRTSKFWPRLIVLKVLHNLSFNCS